MSHKLITFSFLNKQNVNLDHTMEYEKWIQWSPLCKTMLTHFEESKMDKINIEYDFEFDFSLEQWTFFKRFIFYSETPSNPFHYYKHFDEFKFLFHSVYLLEEYFQKDYCLFSLLDHSNIEGFGIIEIFLYTVLFKPEMKKYLQSKFEYDLNLFNIIPDVYIHINDEYTLWQYFDFASQCLFNTHPFTKDFVYHLLLNPFDFSCYYEPRKKPQNATFWLPTPFPSPFPSDTIRFRVNTVFEFENRFYKDWGFCIEKQSFPWKRNNSIVGIAGGTIVKYMSTIGLGEYESSLGHVSDLDIYVCNPSKSHWKELLSYFENKLKSHTVVWHVNGRICNIHLIHLGKTIQLIQSDYTCLYSVISDFSLDYVQCYYTVESHSIVRCNPCCLMAWKTRLVQRLSDVAVSNLVVYKALAKGFSLCSFTQKEIKSVVNGEYGYTTWDGLVKTYQSLKSIQTNETDKEKIKKWLSEKNMEPIYFSLDEIDDKEWKYIEVDDAYSFSKERTCDKNSLQLFPYTFRCRSFPCSRICNFRGVPDSIHFMMPPMKYTQHQNYIIFSLEKSEFGRFLKMLEFDLKKQIYLRIQDFIRENQFRVRMTDQCQIKTIFSSSQKNVASCFVFCKFWKSEALVPLFETNQIFYYQ